MCFTICRPIATHSIRNSMGLIKSITIRLFNPTEDLLRNFFRNNGYILTPLQKGFLKERKMRILFLEKQQRRYSVGLKNQIVMLLISPMLFLMLCVAIGLHIVKHIFLYIFTVVTSIIHTENKTSNKKLKS